MQIREITLTTSPTVVIGDDYIKAGASITVKLDAIDEADLIKEIAQTQEYLKVAYRYALLAELQAITTIQKKKTRVRIVKWLKGIINGKKEARNSEE